MGRKRGIFSKEKRERVRPVRILGVFPRFVIEFLHPICPCSLLSTTLVQAAAHIRTHAHALTNAHTHTHTHTTIVGESEREKKKERKRERKRET